ncbi:MAG: hypothetical protein ACJA0Y_002363 [Maricaulis maris]|jgi:hypothetical protein
MTKQTELAWPELAACLGDGASRSKRNAERPLIGRLNALGRYHEARRKARIKHARAARELPYTPCLGDFETDAILDAIEKAYRDGLAAKHCADPHPNPCPPGDLKPDGYQVNEAN